MALVRTNITIPEEVLALVDEVAGPRGRSAYISDVVARQVRRDNAIRVIRETAGALKGSKAWGETPEETDRILRELRDSSERDRMLYGEDW
jgi:metal-responsive CopG/Arc/MetJ family transcriptional regulator